MTHEHFRQLVLEAGPLLRAKFITAVSESEFEFCFDRQMCLRVQYSPKSHRVTCSMTVGVPMTEDRQQIYEVLLRYNFQWNQTGGVVLSFDSASDKVVLCYAHFVGNMNVTSFCQLVQKFMAKGQVWQKFLQSAGTRSTQLNDPYATQEMSQTSGAKHELLKV